jgi:hypothetical protein
MPLTIRRRLVDRVRQSRKIAYAICAALVTLAAAIVFLSVSSPTTSIDPATEKPFFDENRAFRVAEAMWEQIAAASRDPEAELEVIDWIIEQLPNPELATTEEFTAPMGTEEAAFQNMAVVLEGASSEAILIAAPRNTPNVVKVDPLTWTSGTAVLVELVQVFSNRPHQKTLIFLSTEDAANGGLGIGHFLDTSDYADDVSVILSIHGLGKETSEPGRARVLSAGVTAPQNTTPGWYVQLVGEVLKEAGLDLKLPGLAGQAADHALALSEGDQVAGLTRGIASLRLYDSGAGNPSAEGLATQGPAIERLILSLDSGTETPADPGTALLLKSGRYLTNRAITLLAVLCLLPTIAALATWLISSRVSMRTMLKHLRNLLSFLLPLGFVFLLAYLLSIAGLIPRYLAQVPTADGPSTQPRVAPTLIVLLLGAVVFVASRRFLGYFRPQESRPVTEMAKLCVGFFSLLIGLVLILSRSAFLMLPCLASAWAWPLATCFAEPVYSGAIWRQRLTTNAPLLLVGLVMPLFLYGYVAVSHEVGWWRAWWFLIVQTVSGAYGARGPLAVIFLTAAFAILLGVKRMRVVPVETLEVTDELSMLELPIPRSRRKPRDNTRPPLSPWG